MNRLGPYKKYIIAAAVIQSILVIFVGYILFKSRAEEKSVADPTSMQQQIIENNFVAKL